MSLPQEIDLLGYLEEVAYGRRNDAPARVVRSLLRGLSWVYRFVIWAYLLPFRLGIRKTRRLPVPVISVGNITVGGTGKTPTVQYICRGLVDRGLKPAVLSYGYGGELGGRFGIVSDGKKLLLDARVAGDEPAMLASSMPGVPVLVCKDRRITGQAAVEQLGANILVLDDGFQVWKLDRDMDIVLTSVKSPVDNGFTLPAGRLREPVTALKRAGCVLILGEAEPELLEASRKTVESIAPEARVYMGHFRPSGLRDLSRGVDLSLDFLKGKKVFALSSIGDPTKFQSTLDELGAEIVEAEVYPDHHRYTSEDVRYINRAATDSPAALIVTTEKDAVKLDARQFHLPVIVVGIELHLDCEEGFWEFVRSKCKVVDRDFGR